VCLSDVTMPLPTESAFRQRVFFSELERELTSLRTHRRRLISRLQGNTQTKPLSVSQQYFSVLAPQSCTTNLRFYMAMAEWPQVQSKAEHGGSSDFQRQFLPFFCVVFTHHGGGGSNMASAP